MTRYSSVFGIVLATVLMIPATLGADETPAAIQRALETSGLPFREDVARFYVLRAFRPAWSGSKSAEQNAALVIRTLSQADNEGLKAAAYYVPQSQNPQSAANAASHDIRLTGALLRYASDVRLGQLAPDAVDKDVSLAPQTFDAASVLNAALNTGRLTDALASLPPQRPEYAFLRSLLAQYRALAREGAWPQIPALKGPIETLSVSERKLLQQRLAKEDTQIGDGEISNVELATALRRFQNRQGLVVDGRLGARTVEALNVAPARRIDQIIANMERWRWLPSRFNGRYVSVNVADASLAAGADGKVLFTSRVVAGKPRNPTPILQTNIIAVTVNPPWNVPQSIARKEILPKLLRNHAYLQSQNMVLRNGPPADPHGLSIDWRTVSRSGFPYRIQQLPGPSNALGVLKLESPNRFDVFLHDTSAKTLFSQPERYFSHGCVRVEQIRWLASFVLTGDAQAGLAQLDSKASEGTMRLPLTAPVPVYILYWTAFANPDGTPAFRRDVYGRDDRLIAALRGTRLAGFAANNDTECKV